MAVARKALIPASESDADRIDAAVGLLAAAFADYPLLTWLLGPLAADQKARLSLFDIILRQTKADMFRIEEALDGTGVALWVTSDRLPLFTGTEGRVALRRLRTEIGKNAARRLMRFQLASDRIHPRFGHDYLFLIAVRPECQRCGVGSDLIRRHLQLLDARRLPAVLETSSAGNLLFYKALGFKILDRYRIEDGAPLTWLLSRDPGARG